MEFRYFEVPILTTILKFTTRLLNYSSPLEVSNRSNFPQRLRNFYDSTVELFTDLFGGEVMGHGHSLQFVGPPIVAFP